METRAALTILGAAVIDDVLGLVILGLVVAEAGAGGEPARHARADGRRPIAVVWVVLRWVPGHLDRAMTAPPRPRRRAGGDGRARPRRRLSAMQTWGGLAGITGAYVAGLALARLVGRAAGPGGLAQGRARPSACRSSSWPSASRPTCGRSARSCRSPSRCSLVAVVGKLVGSGARVPRSTGLGRARVDPGRHRDDRARRGRAGRRDRRPAERRHRRRGLRRGRPGQRRRPRSSPRSASRSGAAPADPIAWPTLEPAGARPVSGHAGRAWRSIDDDAIAPPPQDAPSDRARRRPTAASVT